MYNGYFWTRKFPQRAILDKYPLSNKGVYAIKIYGTFLPFNQTDFSENYFFWRLQKPLLTTRDNIFLAIYVYSL